MDRQKSDVPSISWIDGRQVDRT